MLEINERLNRLEKSNRRLRIAAYGFPVLAGSMLLLGAAKPDLTQAVKFEAVLTKQLVVSNGPGTPAIAITAGEDGGSVSISDVDGKKRVMLAYFSDMGALMTLGSESGADIRMMTSNQTNGNFNRGDASIDVDAGDGGVSAVSAARGSFRKLDGADDAKNAAPARHANEAQEQEAAALLSAAQAILKSGNRVAYRKQLEQIIKAYPDTRAAGTAKKALK